jgi:N-acetyl-1-D-myo-inositol-2-amino-2-deoxy-alpha-D-glucopyranoside deacetylase
MARLLAFIPHPDDESYSFAGTLALAAKAGWECQVVCVSSGEKGKRHDGGPGGREAIGAVREAELRRSCSLLGAKPPAFLRMPDGAVSAVALGPSAIAGLIDRFASEIVVTLGHDGAYGHPDHLAVHRWVTGAWSAGPASRGGTLLYPVFPRGLFLPQWEKCRHMLGEPPDPPAEAIGSDSFHYEVDIRAVRETKRASIAAHRTQLPGGDPEGLFPPGVVSKLLDVERFEDASGKRNEATAELLASLAP